MHNHFFPIIVPSPRAPPHKFNLSSVTRSHLLCAARTFVCVCVHSNSNLSNGSDCGKLRALLLPSVRRRRTRTHPHRTSVQLNFVRLSFYLVSVCLFIQWFQCFVWPFRSGFVSPKHERQGHRTRSREEMREQKGIGGKDLHTCVEPSVRCARRARLFSPFLFGSVRSPVRRRRIYTHFNAT